MSDSYYVGVDVGTSSVRAALVTHTGRVHRLHTLPITVANPQPDFYEQDSQEIWQAVCQCVKAVTQGVEDKGRVRGLGFDATCSLVVLDNHLQPVTVSPTTGEDRFNVVMWMDHRARQQAEHITSLAHPVLKYVGGKMSLEMQTPKLLWLKTHLPDTWGRAAHFLDLPDFLTLQASGRLTRSLCSLVCKWTYMHGGKTQGWDPTFFKAVGLHDLADDNWHKIGQEVVAPGTRCGPLTAVAAGDMGLTEQTWVGASLIDAHAGGLALLAAQASTPDDLLGRLGLVGGTSTCHLCLSAEPLEVGGVWGPYCGVVVAGRWLAEGGQSATGALLDHLINTHPATAKCPQQDVYGWLEEVVAGAAEGLASPALLTTNLHLYPDFHGNRSPLADPTMKGMLCGLTLDTSERSLGLLYLATLQALAYGTRQIVERLQAAGHQVRAVLLCGGLAKSPSFLRTHADALGVPVLVPEEQQSVLLGAAMLAATASGDYTDLTAAAMAMGGQATTCLPDPKLKRFHDQKYSVFLKMQQDQLEYRRLMTQK